MAQNRQDVRLLPGPTPQIYIVAHSEGSVVSFLGLLQALSVPSIPDPDAESTNVPTDWIKFVRGFMTIGSPIDKHLVLWPKLWEHLQIGARTSGDGGAQPPGEARLTLEPAIEWRNYYDFGDPIGFKLETAVQFLHENNCQAFKFRTADHDFGFSRYLLPGKAHTDYWGDPEVFGHFIDDVVIPAKAKAVRPESKSLFGVISSVLAGRAATLRCSYGSRGVRAPKAVTAFLSPDKMSASRVVGT